MILLALATFLIGLSIGLLMPEPRREPKLDPVDPEPFDGRPFPRLYRPS